MFWMRLKSAKGSPIFCAIIDHMQILASTTEYLQVPRDVYTQPPTSDSGQRLNCRQTTCLRFSLLLFSDEFLHGCESFWSFLRKLHRQLSVKYRNHVSKPCAATSKVPQGSNLSHLLFLLYINDSVEVMIVKS